MKIAEDGMGPVQSEKYVNIKLHPWKLAWNLKITQFNLKEHHFPYIHVIFQSVYSTDSIYSDLAIDETSDWKYRNDFVPLKKMILSTSMVVHPIIRYCRCRKGEIE